MNTKNNLTTGNGAPIPDDDNSISAGSRGPLTFDNFRLFEKLAHFNRERIPERVVHARGYGAHGTFTLTKDLSDYTIAPFLQGNNKKTDIFMRFSTVAGGQDSSDYVRDVRGFSVRFYTEEGNYDIVGNNTPVFFLRDPSKFPDFIHSQKKDPRTNLPNLANQFEFWVNNPQSLHQITILMSDRGIPKSLRHINGYGSHTLSMWNKNGQRFWVKWHFKTNQGIETLTNQEAEQMPANGMQADLVDSIDHGEYPGWTVKIQVMTEDQAKDYSINPFDLTKVWPHSDFPLVEIGQLELNRNVENYFAETEQSAFAPSNLVPGVGASPDKMLQARLFAYADAHRYRIGANNQQLPINRPKCPVHHYQRDGTMAAGAMCPYTGHNQDASTNFYPNNQKDTPKPRPDITEPAMPLEEHAWVKAHDSRDEDNFTQAGDLFRLMTENQKTQLCENIAGALQPSPKDIQKQMIDLFAQCDTDYGKRVHVALKALSA